MSRLSDSERTLWNHKWSWWKDIKINECEYECDFFMDLDLKCQSMYMSALVAQMVKIRLQCRKPRFKPWVRKMFWRREWPLTAVFFPDGYLLQYSCLENSLHRGAWWATVHGVAKSQTWSTEQPTLSPSHVYINLHAHTWNKVWLE